MAARAQGLERRGTRLPPSTEMGTHACYEPRELGVPVNRGLDGRLFHGEIDIAWAEFFEQRVAEPGAHFPVGLERIDIGDRDAAMQVPGDVLEILARLAVDVAR